MNIQKCVMVGLFAACGVLAMKGEAHASCSGTNCAGLIEHLRVDATGIAKIDPEGGTSPSNCTMNGPYVNLDISTINGQEIYRTLLAAYLAGKPVTIRTADTPGAACTVAYVTLPNL